MRLLIAIGVFLGLAVGLAKAESFEIWPGSGLNNEFETHQECEQHAYSRALFNFQLWNEYQRVVNILNGILDVNPETGSCGGWGGGALYKPESESTGQIVFLLPRSYCDGTRSLISNVRVISKATGQEVASTRLRHCGQHNGNRLHMNVLAKAEDLRAVSPLQVLYDFNGVTECREVPDSTQRYD